MSDQGPEQTAPESMGHGAPTSNASKAWKLRFWCVLAALCLLAFVSALDVAIISAALPFTTAKVGGAAQCAWIANSFVFASAALQPLTEQLANVFGRRVPLVLSVVLFAVGSGVAGRAQTAVIFIFGRTVQDVGAGGINVLLDIVICDLVPLHERGKYLGLVFSFAGLAAGLGPVVGGALAQVKWRWIFLLNLPVCGIVLVAISLFMRVENRIASPQLSGKPTSKIGQIDVSGSLLFTPSVLAIGIGLVMGGIQYRWSSWRIVVPLVLGVAGWVAFHIHQPLARHPSVPARLFSNRTPAKAYILTFLSSILVQSVIYFMPAYFQTVLSTTVVPSGIHFLPFAMGTLFLAVIGGILLSKFGAYRPFHATALVFSAVGFGLFTLLDEWTTEAAWVFFQLIATVGAGIIQLYLLPAIMAALAESDVTAATAAYNFIRTFGWVWGVAVPSLTFNAVFDDKLHLMSSPKLRSHLGNGAAYAFASRAYQAYQRRPVDEWDEVVQMYENSLRIIWWAGLAISIVAFFTVRMGKGMKLREELDTEYGIKTDQKTKAVEKASEAGDVGSASHGATGTAVQSP